MTPDQLAVLVTCSSCFSRPDDPPGDGFVQLRPWRLAAAIGDLSDPRAIIGATDQALRQH